MTPIEKIHTFARRWCMQRAAELRQRHDLAKQRSGFDGDRSVDTRIAILEAIQLEVELLTPADFTSRQHAALRLIELKDAMPTHARLQPMRRHVHNQELIREECDSFAKAIRQFAEQQDWKHWSVEPLPYRRTLGEQERTDLLARLWERWSIVKEWSAPLDQLDLPYKAMVFDSKAIEAGLSAELLRSALAKQGITRLYELCEISREPSFEIDIALWEPHATEWTGAYSLTDAMDWLYYITMDGATLVIGDWLLAQIKAGWPEWKENLWKAPAG